MKTIRCGFWGKPVVGGCLTCDGSIHVPDLPSPLPAHELGDLEELGEWNLCPEDGGAEPCKEQRLLSMEADL